MSGFRFDIPVELTEALQNAHKISALTGSGVSDESGVPTFRDAQTGLWAHFEPQDLATPEAFDRDPRLVWEWYEWRRELVSRAEPNAAHRALAELGRRANSFTLITQNVDGLHQRAGSAYVVELHGNIARTVCSAERTVVEPPGNGEKPPRCPRCGAYLRPDVVWFGESLPVEAFGVAFEAARDCDVFLSIGTSSLVQPAASLPVEALSGGATVVEVNPDRTPLSAHATFTLQGAAGEVLPALVKDIYKHSE